MPSADCGSFAQSSKCDITGRSLNCAHLPVVAHARCDHHHKFLITSCQQLMICLM